MAGSSIALSDSTSRLYTCEPKVARICQLQADMLSSSV